MQAQCAEVVIIGAGIAGIVFALELLDQGCAGIRDTVDQAADWQAFAQFEADGQPFFNAMGYSVPAVGAQKARALSRAAARKVSG